MDIAEEEKQMRKGKKSLSIGAKVYSMLFILIASFIFYNIIANQGLNEAKASIRSLTNVYLEMQKENEIVSKNVAEIRLYSNLMVMMADEAAAKQLAESLPSFITTIDEALLAMHAHAESIENQELLEALVVYENKTHVLEENITATATALLAGDKASATLSNNRIGIAVILDAASGPGYSDPEVRSYLPIRM